MDDHVATQYMQKLETAMKEGTLSARDALARAFALGCETERMAAMHHACAEFSRARAARERAFQGG